MDKVYRVTVKYQLDKAQAEAGFRGLIERTNAAMAAFKMSQRETDKLTDAHKQLGRAVQENGGFFKSLASGVALGAGFALISKSINGVVDGIKAMTSAGLEFNAKMQETRIGLGGLIQANQFGGNKDFNVSLEAAQELIAQMRKDAAALPGTFQDLNDVVQQMVSPGAAAGKSLREIEQFSAKAMAVGKTFGLDSGTIGREAAMMLEGHATAQNVLYRKMKPLLEETFGGAGFDTKQFNQMDVAKKYDIILKTLEKFNPAIKEYEETWDVISSTAKDYLSQIAGAGSEGLFAGLSAMLEEFNAWFMANSEEILTWAREVGRDLADGFRMALSVVKEIAEALKWVNDNVRKPVIDQLGGENARSDARGYGNFRLMMKANDWLDPVGAEAAKDEMFDRKYGTTPQSRTNAAFQSAARAVGMGVMGGDFAGVDLLDMRGRNKLSDEDKKKLAPQVNIQITQTINESENPDRVILKTKEALRQALQTPIESAGSVSALLQAP